MALPRDTAPPPPDTRPPPPPMTVVIAFQRGVAPSAAYVNQRDGNISEDMPSLIWAMQPAASVDGDDPNGSGHDRYGLFYFDLTLIPSNATVQKVELALTIVEPSVDQYRVFELRRTWSAVSWRAAGPGMPWQVPGAKGDMDRGTAVLGTAGPSEVGMHLVPFTKAGIDAVQRWVRDPTTNQGFIVADEANTDGLDYSTVDEKTPTARPKLTVTYTVP